MRTAMLWTGGKDSTLALLEARRMGLEVVSLVTFAPPYARFRAHPLEVIRVQAESLGVPHRTLEVQAPHEEDYRRQIGRLCESLQLQALVTGDIAEVNGHPNFIEDRCREFGVEVIRPLWHADRLQLLQRLFSFEMSVIFSCVKRPWFDRSWLGRRFDPAVLRELREIAARTGMDLCGEEGEYHTLVLGGPMFSRDVEIRGTPRDAVDGILHLEVHHAGLAAKVGV